MFLLVPFSSISFYTTLLYTTVFSPSVGPIFQSFFLNPMSSTKINIIVDVEKPAADVLNKFYQRVAMLC